MTYAITGATGQLGSIVIDKIKAAAPAGSIVALARDPAKAGGLGVGTRKFDYSEPETLSPALAGVDVLLLISFNQIGQRVEQHRRVIETAGKAGVKRIVYTSVLRADTSALFLAAEHAATELALKESGLAFTILRNGWYSENYAGSIAGALANGVLVGSAGEGRISAATREDYAEAAVAALIGDGHAGRTYELAGDEAFTLADLAAEVSRQAGREIAYRNLPVEEYAAILKSAGVPEVFATLDVPISEGALFHEGRELSALIGRPTTPLAVAVKKALGRL